MPAGKTSTVVARKRERRHLPLGVGAKLSPLYHRTGASVGHRERGRARARDAHRLAQARCVRHGVLEIAGDDARGLVHTAVPHLLRCRRRCHCRQQNDDDDHYQHLRQREAAPMVGLVVVDAHELLRGHERTEENVRGVRLLRPDRGNTGAADRWFQAVSQHVTLPPCWPRFGHGLVMHVRVWCDRLPNACDDCDGQHRSVGSVGVTALWSPRNTTRATLGNTGLV